MKEQAKLYILGDFSVKENEIDTLVHQSTLLDFSSLSAKWKSHRDLFGSFPDKAMSSIQLDHKNENGEHFLHFNGIQIRISKHLIQFNTEILFKSWRDFEDLRLTLNDFLSGFLRLFQSRSLLFIPSFWEQPFGSVKNEWNERRLQQLQHKITCEAVSFKRTLLNLHHCLGEPQKSWDFSVVSEACYWLFPFFDVDSGKLAVCATLKEDSNPLKIFKAVTDNTVFSCHEEWRNNSCPFLNYNGKSTETGNSKRVCRLQPFLGKYENVGDFVQQNGYVCWNKYCFFTLKLYHNRILLTFSKPAAVLMRTPHKEECLRFIKQLISLFPVLDIWMSSAETFENLGAFKTIGEMRDYLEDNYVFYRNGDVPSSWRQDIGIF